MASLQWVGFCYVIIIIICGIQGRGLIFERHTREAQCGFRCKNGECIDEDKECDGKADCRDNSDETDSCKTITCPKFLFRCAYGACIPADKECDGNKDCFDNSDEVGDKCNLVQSSGKCGNTEFECTSGECISNDFLCNGTPQCRDNSDESVEMCSNFYCPGYTFKCKYGACVDGNSECNGVQDCFDNSDEDPTVCRRPVPVPTTTTERLDVTTTTVAPPENFCTLPSHPQNGHWEIYGDETSSLQPGGFVKSSVVLTYKCKSGYDPQEEWNLCIKGVWLRQNIQCVRICPPLTSTITTTVSCTLNNAKINCSKAVEGTVAEFTCEKYYEDSSAKTRFCSDGTWNKQKPNCVPACGKKSAYAKTMIIGGDETKVGDYPWHTAIYRKNGTYFEYICGGSLINQRVIITAAHCLTFKSNGTAKDRTLYKVGVGKYYREYLDPRDKNAQYSSVKHILVPDGYYGGKHDYVADLALIVTEKIFELNDRIQPICLDEDNTQIQLTSQIPGLVIGWGWMDQVKTPTDAMRELTVPYVEQSQCESELPIEFKEKYLLKDKLCAGYLNKTKSVCGGDSGGGLAFINRYGRYFIKGIVSISPQTEQVCTTEEYALYTRTSSYLNFIIPALTKHGYMYNN